MNSSGDQRLAFPAAPNGRPPREGEKRGKDRIRQAPAERHGKTEPSLIRMPRRHEYLTSAGYPRLPARKQPPRGITASEDKQRNRRSDPACVRAITCRPKDAVTTQRKCLRVSADCGR